MKCVMVMYDTLNRHHLSPYGCEATHTPNFARLAEKSVTFDTSYVCSMPCMPARREMHTGRPNFLHRSWGPLEPFDDSVPQMLHQAGTYTHLATDHYHYFEEGGTNYHTKFSSWEFFRGQEGDPWMPSLGKVTMPEKILERESSGNRDWMKRDWANRNATPFEHQQPQPMTFEAGLGFIEKFKSEDNWFLQIETFDPHEPFRVPEKYRSLFPDDYDWDEHGFFDWPTYIKKVYEHGEDKHVLNRYKALVAMCDAYLGEVLDRFDEHNLWEDTMLIVCTDHGFMLGEHDWWGKMRMPFYEEIAHTPFFVWDPRSGKAGERRQSLVQPSIDLPVTLLGFFGVEPTEHMIGADLAATIADDTPVRETGIFGLFGAHVNITDGRYVYMRGPANEKNTPLYNYTLMPAHMRTPFGEHELQENNVSLAPPFSFTKGMPTLKVGRGEGIGWLQFTESLLWDVKDDPEQSQPIDDPKIEARLIAALNDWLNKCDAPAEQRQRLGLEA